MASPGMLPVSRRLGRKSHEDVTKGGGDYRRGLQSCAIHAFAWSQVENRSTGIRQDGRVPRQGVKDPAILWEGDPKPFDPSLMPRTIAGVHLDQARSKLDPFRDECRTFALLDQRPSTPGRRVLTLPS